MFGVPGFTYLTQRSTNLALGNWVSISTNTVPANGVLQVIDSFTDFGDTAQNPSFYRLLEKR
jgi:hypothetical protein